MSKKEAENNQSELDKPIHVLNYKENPIEFSCITAYVEDKWLIKITKDGFEFNRKEFPLSQPCDFSDAFMKILENSYPIKFLNRDKK